MVTNYHIAPHGVACPLENATGQTGSEQQPQFLALCEMGRGDGAAADYWFHDLAHRVPNEDAVDLAYRTGPIVPCADKQGVGEVEMIGLGRIEGPIKEVFDSARHIPKIFRRTKQHPVTGEQIL